MSLLNGDFKLRVVFGRSVVFLYAFSIALLQFRAVSYGLYGSQEYHQSVRQKAVEFMKTRKQDYAAFLGENIEDYLTSMEHSGTWGDELTLVFHLSQHLRHSLGSTDAHQAASAHCPVTSRVSV